MAPGVSLRAATADDDAFLYSVYASTRADELRVLQWDAVVTEQFLKTQFDVQSRAYRAAHPAATQDVVLLHGKPIGRLYVERSEADIHVIDIALLPEHRGRGIGTSLMRSLIGEARSAGRRVVLETLRDGAARALYERLGFETVQDGEVYVRLAWRGDQFTTTS